MIRSQLALAVCAAVSCLSPIPAQEPAPPDGVGIHAPGDRAGNLRYVVTFSTRPFDVSAFRAAVLAKRSAAEVDAIVAHLERRARAHHAGFAAAVEAAGGLVHAHWWLIDGLAFEAPPAAIAGLRALPNIAAIDGDHTTMPCILTATNAANHNSDAVNAAGNRGANVTVAIMDTGLDSLSGSTGKPHPTFFVNGDVNNTTGGGIFGSRMLANVQMGAWPADNTHSHGTGVAGIAAGAKWFNNAAYDDGHAPLAKVVGYSIANNSGGSALESVMAGTWQQMAADRVRYNIVAANNSYTGYSNSVLNVIQQMLDAAVYNADLLAVVAAGNGGTINTYSQPAANGLAVAATNATVRTIAGFSGRGPLSTPDSQQFWPDISANGVNTVMPMVDNPSASYNASGTSMASPQVCGAAALVRNANQDLNAQETKAILLATAESIAAQNGALTRQAYGQGYLRDDRAVALAGTAGAAFTRTLASTTTPNTHSIGVTASQSYRVVLCWPRRLAASNSSAWSDLRLRVLNGATQVALSDDARMLYEAVTFTATSTGVYTVEVSASQLEGGAPIEYSIAHTASPLGYTPGSFATFGTACAGTAGVPAMGSRGAPTIGAYWGVTVTGARATTAAILAVGASNTTWGSLTLPAPIVGTPCWFNVSHDIVVISGTDAAGAGAIHMRLPATTAWIGLTAHFQWFVLDIGANALDLVSTRGGTAIVGGQQ